MDLTVNEGTLRNPDIIGQTGSTITVNINENRGQGTGIYFTDNNVHSIDVDTLTIINNVNDQNNGKGVYSYNNAEYTVDVNKLIIKSYDDGVFMNGRGD